MASNGGGSRSLERVGLQGPASLVLFFPGGPLLGWRLLSLTAFCSDQFLATQSLQIVLWLLPPSQLRDKTSLICYFLVTLLTEEIMSTDKPKE